MDKPLVRILAFSTLLLMACGQPVSQASQPVNKMVRDTIINVPTLDFSSLEPRLYTNSDSVYTANFWAMWCAPCVKELPYFEEYLARHGKEKTAVLLVSMDFPNQIQDKLLPFLNQRQIYRSEVVLLDAPDANSWIDRIEPSWSGAIPATLIFNRDTSIFIARPFTDLADLESAISSINN